MMREINKDTKVLYEKANEALVTYYNKPYNYSKLVSLLNSSFGKLLDVTFISNVFKSKQALHKMEKQFMQTQIAMDFHIGKMATWEYREKRKFRMEAIHNGMTTESSIQAHIECGMTEYLADYETFNAYKNAISGIKQFLDKENRNIEALLSQGKSLSYAGYKYNDETSLFGYGEETD